MDHQQRSSKPSPLRAWTETRLNALSIAHPSTPDTNKPLPHLPSGQREDGSTLRRRPAQREVGTDTTNGSPSKLKSRHRAKLSKTQISRPLLQESTTSSGTDANISRPSNDTVPLQTHAGFPSRPSTDPVADLGRKIEMLLAQQDASNKAAAALKKGVTKHSGARGTLQRGKNVLTRFKDTLNDHLGHHSSARATAAGAIFGEGDAMQGVTLTEPCGVIPDPVERARPFPVTPAGPFLIRRKPVPISKDSPCPSEGGENRESSPTFTHGADHHEPSRNDPDTDVTSVDAEFESTFGWVKSLASSGGPPPKRPTDFPNSPSTGSGFDADVSGNGSRPTLGLISPSAVDHGTPRIRFEPRLQADGSKTLTRIRPDATSLLGNFDFESRHNTPEQSLVAPAVSDGASSIGLKRKNSTKQASPDGSGKAHKRFKKRNSSTDVTREITGFRTSVAERFESLRSSSNPGSRKPSGRVGMSR